MSLSIDLAALFKRDLSRLLQEVSAFPDQASLWAKPEGVSNSAGNLALHLDGNLREYIGRQLGNIEYIRNRQSEFSSTGFSLEDVLSGIRDLPDSISQVVAGLPSEALDRTYPEAVFGMPLTTRQFLIHLLGHLNYHLGQIDYIRRILTKGKAISLAGL